MTLHSFYSRGKLLITGEYLILEGAEALAVPVRFGQQMHVRPIPSNHFIHWKTYDLGRLWFESKFDLQTNKVISTTDSSTSSFLLAILDASRNLNPEFLIKGGYVVVSEIDFDLQWGLGSSSSLISNIAYWADVDPFQLHSLVSTGSGYDIACARAHTPLLYRVLNGEPFSRPVDFNPIFSDQLYFIYLGQKQNSDSAIKLFRETRQDFSCEIDAISNITSLLLQCVDQQEFAILLKTHETIMAKVLHKKPVKEKMFHDFEGEMKSLGAWGGDFVLAYWPHDKAALAKYLTNKGYPVYFGYDEMVYNQHIIL